MRTIFEEFGINVRNRRNDLELTQNQLAEKSDLDRSTIQLIEYGQTNVTLKTIKALADALEVHPADLLKTE